jgi:hypothetical protein
VEERKHCEGLGRCILAFTRIEADAPQIFFLHLEDRMNQLPEIIEAATEAH